MEPEDIISSIPTEDYRESGINLKFMRLSPTFRIIEKKVPFTFFFDNLKSILEQYENNGICISLNESNLKISNYYKFVKSLFANQKVNVIDEQRVGNGSPDFKLQLEGEKTFYIEFKSKNNGIQANQLQWLGEHLETEVWFLILGEIEFLEESYPYRQMRESIGWEKEATIDKISSQIASKVQSLQIK
jgi:hypothetical protein